MDMEENAEDQPTHAAERRAKPRFEIDDDAKLLLVADDRLIQCRVLDLSLGGCRLRTKERFKAGPDVRVEVSFRVNGIAFRFSGVTQWTNQWNVVGIEFVDVPQRRQRDLAEVVDEVGTETAARLARMAADSAPAEDAEPGPASDLLPATDADKPALEPHSEPSPEQSAEYAPDYAAECARIHAVEDRPAPLKSTSRSTGQTPGILFNRERRAQSRYAVDTTAAICLIHTGSKLSGRILDLSLDGCRIRTDAPFHVGIYTRIEVEFSLQGTPFRVAGVLQAIHERRLVGIRFLDVGERKRGQLEQLIGEIEEQEGPVLSKEP